MRSHILAVALAVLAINAPPLSSTAAENTGVAAQLSWSATDPLATNLANPGATNRLYLHLRHGVTSFKGAEFDLKWAPLGDPENGCMAHTGTEFRTSAGTTCTYLNRGTAIPVTGADDPGHFHVSWANGTVLTSCGAGIIATVLMEFEGCTDASSQFTLCSLRLLDANNEISDINADSLGTIVTVLGGGNQAPDCAGSSQSGFAPQISQFSDTTLFAEQGLVLQPVAADPDGGSLAWSGENLPPGGTVDGATGLLTWVGGDSAVVYPAVTLVATDPQGLSASSSFTVAVSPHPRTLGIFQAYIKELGITPLEIARLTELGAQWYHRTIFPLYHPDYATLDDYLTQFVDPTVQAAQAFGMEIVLNLSTATDASLQAHWPPTGFTATDWSTAVQHIVERYSLQATGAMPGLLSSVIYWHVEEETAFLQQMSVQQYEDEYNATRTAVKVANPLAKTILVGFASDPTWGSAFLARKTYLYPVVPWEFQQVDTTDAPVRFRTRAEAWMGHLTYDAVDFHSYARTFVTKGEVAWIRSHTTKPIWCFEMGGPHEATAVVPNWPLVGYTETTHSWFTPAIAAEALANGVARVAMVFYPPGPNNNDQSIAYNNICLFRPPASELVPPGPFLKKPAFETYATLIRDMTSWWHAYDERLQFEPGWQPDTNAVFNMQLNWDPRDNVLATGIPPDTLLQGSVLWCDSTVSVTLRFHNAGYPTIVRVDSVALDTLGTTSATYTPTDSLVMQITRSPLIVLSNARYDVVWGNQIVGLGSPTYDISASSVRAVPGASGQIEWRLAAPSARARIEVYDARGRQRGVWQLPRDVRSGQLSLHPRRPAWEAGVYLVRLVSGNETRANCKLVTVR